MLQSDLIAILDGEYKRAGNEYHGPCPYCGGRDRFVIFNTGRYWCRQCQRSGDAIQILRDRDGMTYAQACDRLGISPAIQDKANKTMASRPAPASAQPQPAPAPQLSTSRHADHDRQAWQQCAFALATRAKTVYHDEPAGAPGRDYLASRGISRLTAIRHQVGYIPTDYKTVWGGLSVAISSGLMIAWADPCALPHKINVRRLDGRTPKYIMVTGSTNGLYNSWRIQRSAPIVLCEGEIDAMTIAEATREHWWAVATGSTTGGRTAQAIARLSQADRVLVAFDADQPGENAAQWWLKALPNEKARRIRPTRHDINAMHLAGDDISQWLASALT